MTKASFIAKRANRISNTVPWSSSKGQEGIGVDVVFVLFAEPEQNMNKYQ